MRDIGHLRGALYGLGAAMLFGVSAPVAKLLVTRASPLVIAGLLYLGAGLGLVALGLLPGLRGGRRARQEAPLRAADVGLLLAVVIAGGVVGPLLMLVGLRRVSGVAGSLLLNLEAPFTMLLAVLLFGEHLGRRSAVAAALIVLGAALLGSGQGNIEAEWVGVVAVAGACGAWGVDNNLTQRLSLRDPVAVARLKGLGAGATMLLAAGVLGQPLPGGGVIVGGLLLGSVSYGLSVVLDVLALRLLGAAREAAVFATAPFAGALVAVPLLGERWGGREIVAFIAMAGGVALLLRERHVHLHAHEALEHEHAHVHDEHHQHEHDPETVIEPHSHRHRHAPLTHDHSHVSDAHHRHLHAPGGGPSGDRRSDG